MLFGSWLETTDDIETTRSSDVHEFADRLAIRYSFRVRNGDGVFLVEQQGCLAVNEDGRIADAAIVCSGYRPVDAIATR